MHCPLLPLQDTALCHDGKYACPTKSKSSQSKEMLKINKTNSLLFTLNSNKKKANRRQKGMGSKWPKFVEVYIEVISVQQQRT